MFKVSKLQGAGLSGRPENSPYVLSQMLVPAEMLLCGLLMGLIALVAEIKRSKESREKRANEENQDGAYRVD